MYDSEIEIGLINSKNENGFIIPKVRVSENEKAFVISKMKKGS